MQVAIGWLLARSPVIVPIPGTSSVAHLDENVAAAAERLSQALGSSLGLRLLAVLSEAALEISSQLEGLHPLDSARVYGLLGEVYAALGDAARAREVLELAIEQLEAQGPSRYLVNAYKRLAALLKDEGRSEEALELLERALGVQEQAGRALG